MSSKSKPSAIVMGAGIGGLSTAGQLASHGYMVTVLEKNATPGGKIIRFKKGDFTFDGGPSFITLTEVYRDWFASQGVKLEDYIRLKKMDETTTFHFAGGKKMTLYTDPGKVREQIRTRFPGDEQGFDRFMEMSGKIYELLYRGPRFARRNYHKLFGFDYVFHPQVFSFLGTLHIHESWKAIVDRLFQHEELRAVFSYQATFLGMRPSEALGTYCFFPWAEIHDGMYQVEGGIYGIVEGFVKRCRELGVKFVYDAEVERLEYTETRLTAVQSTQGRYEADIFVSNIDGAYFYDRLMPPERNRTFPKGSLERMKHTNSYFTINLGLKKPVPGCTHHTFYVAREWEDFTENILKAGSVPKFTPENTCYYFLQPSLLEPGTAPPGKTTAFILIPVPGYDPGFDWTTYEETFKNFIYDIMEQRDGIPIRSLIEEEVVYSPARWGSEFNLWENVILSFSLNFLQANGFRMPNRSREFDNLYFAGSSTIPGPGIPPCISSGELVVERILEDTGRNG